ncbi:MAG: helix-turn-helix domain-containing protein [Solirubrobacteraceae bacterium]
MGTPRIALLEVDPELGRHLPAEDLEQARTALTVTACDVAPGTLQLARLAPEAINPFAAYVVSGLLTRDIDIGGQPALELLGPGDVLVGKELQGTLPVRTRLVVSAQTRIALLDDRLLAGVRHWPRLLPGLMQRVCAQRDQLALQLAISHQPRVEDRLMNLFWHLSDRFGSVTPEGICLPVSLTHEALGRLIGARRPTVTLALRALDARGALRRREDRSWLVAEWPPERKLDDAGLGPRARPVPVAVEST